MQFTEGDDTPPPGAISRKSPTIDQGVQTSGGVMNNAGGTRQSRGGGGYRGNGEYRGNAEYRGNGDNRRYQQQSNSYSRYPQDMRGRPPMRGMILLCVTLYLRFK